MANRFAQYGPSGQAQPSNRFSGFANGPIADPNAPVPYWTADSKSPKYLDPNTGLPPAPAPNPQAAYDILMRNKHGDQNWTNAKAVASSVAAQLPSTGRSFANGGLMNWLPEATAYPVGAAVSAGNAVARATGGKPRPYTGDAYRDAIISGEHQAQDQWASQHPIANTALNLLGSAASTSAIPASRFIEGWNAPGALRAAGAKNLAGATARSSVLGGLTGATAGAGENYTDRGQGAVWGGVSGAGLGLALPSAVALASKVPSVLPRGLAGAKQGFGELGSALGIPQGDVSTTPQSDAQALKFLKKVAGSRGVTADSVLDDPRVQAGLPVKGANLLGKRGVNLATGLAKGSDDSADVLDPIAREQLRSTAPGVVSDFHSLTGIDPNAAHGDVVAQAAAGRTKAAPLYEQAYSIGGVDSPTLQGLMPRLQATGAIGKAMNIAAIEGRDPTELGFRWQPEQFSGGQQTVMDRVQVPGGGTMDVPRQVDAPAITADTPVQVQNPTMQTWDYVKRGLDDALEAYRDPVTRRLNLDTRGRAILGLQNDLRGELTNKDTAWGPNYQAALDAGGDPIRLEQAFTEGSRLIKNNVHPRDFQTRWGTYSPAEQQAFMGGFADDLNGQLGAGKLRPKDLLTPWTQQKLTTMMGDPDAANDFLGRVQMRADLAKEAARYAPGTNSPTAEANAANQEMSGTPAAFSAFAEKPGLEGLIKSGINLASAPARGFVNGFMAPLSPAGRVSFAQLLASDPQTFSQSLTSGSQPPPIPGLLPPAVSPTSGLIGGATAYGPQ